MTNNGVKVSLGSETFFLEYSLEAFRNVPAMLDGFMGAFTKLAQADSNACIAIIAVGSGASTNAKEHERIAGLLYENGLAGVIPALSEYVGMLQVGGVKRKEAQSASAGES